MDFGKQLLEPFALMAVLACVAAVFVRVLDAVVRRRHHPIRLGVELLAALGVLYLALEPAFRYLGAMDLQAPATDALALLWWLSLAYLVNALMHRFVWGGVPAEGRVRKVPKLLTDATSVLIYACAVMVVMHFVYDQPVTSVVLTSGAAAFVVGLSAQSTLKEVFAGISLNATHALRLGDYVEIDSIYGQVYDINWRSISVHNPHTDSLYIFPNSAVAERIVLNYSEPTDRFKNTVTFVVEPSACPEVVGRTVLESLESSVYVLRDPKPDINMLGFSDLGIEYRIRYYFEGDDPWWDAQNEVIQAIWSSLRRRGLRLSVDRHKLQTGDELSGSPWLQAGEQDAVPLAARLRATRLFSQLPKARLEALAERARQRDYTPPEYICVEGEEATRLYFVCAGKLAVVRGASDRASSEFEVGVLGPGSLIGMEGLLGEGSYSETLQARRYCTVYELDIAPVLDALGDGAKWRGKVEEIAAKQKAEFDAQMELALDAHRHREHRRHRTHLMRHMREHADAFFARPILHRALAAIMPGHVENTLLESMMAAAALVATARGEVDEKEIAYLHSTLHQLDLFRHIDADRGLRRFKAHVEAIENDPKDGREEALRAVSVVAADKHMAEIVMGTAHGITGLLERSATDEFASVEQIAARLHMPVTPDALMEQTRRRGARVSA